MITSSNIIPISKARATLSDLTEKVSGSEIVVLTKSGRPKAALVDVVYLEKLQKEVKRLYAKTFIDPKFAPSAREFSTKEIEEWKKEDEL